VPVAGTAPDDLDRLVAGVLLPGFEGTSAPDWLRRRLDDGLAGVVLFARNIHDDAQLTALTQSLRDHRPEALCAVDEEGGDVTRLFAATGSPHPGHLALGMADDTAQTRAVAADIGRILRAAGIDWNFAPDADVNSNPHNPVIGVRSFGGDPGVVARHVTAYVKGLQIDAGVAACAKHFPGHGDTDVDSHLGLPRIARDRAALGMTELVPFAAAVAAGVRSVMTGHLLLPAIDASLPATLSPVIVGDLLRGELGFSGLVVSDALEMGGVAKGFGIERAATLALGAGVDALCLGGGLADDDVVTRTHGAIRRAVTTGELPEERLIQARARVDDLVRWCRNRRGPATAGTVDPAPVRCSGDVSLPAGPVYLVTLEPKPGIAAGPGPWGLDQLLAEARPGTAGARLHEGADPSAVLAAASGLALVIVVRDPHRHDWMRTLATALLAERPDAVVVEMGLPNDALQGLSRGRIETYGASVASARAAVRALLPDADPTRPDQ
jgi:beta-N-acetylhexosaminidase